MNARDQRRNTTWDELNIGDEASVSRTVTTRDLYLFAHASGNLNPIHLPVLSHPNDVDKIAPSMWIGSLVSAVLGNVLPGPGTLYVGQQFDFVDRAKLGDVLTVTIRLLEKHVRPQATFETIVVDQAGQLVVQGRARVIVPTQSQVIDETNLPALLMDTQDHFQRLLTLTRDCVALPTVVVCPDDESSLGGALLARDEKLISPILIGNKKRIEATAQAHHLTLGDVAIVDIDDHRAAATHAVKLVNEGQARAIMKGNLHSDELLAQVVKRDGGLRGHRRISHVFVLDVPTLDEPIFITDAAINIAPDLATKVDITQNAIDLARACGLQTPRVAILSAVETVNLGIPSSMDAAIITKMANRGQITGGIVDGPLAMDNAIDMMAAKAKHLESDVAGRAQVLVVPNLEAGNMLAKQLTFVSHAQPAGLVIGAKVPIMLTSRADNARARLFSCVLALLYDRFCHEKGH